MLWPFFLTILILSNIVSFAIFASVYSGVCSYGLPPLLQMPLMGAFKVRQEEPNLTGHWSLLYHVIRKEDCLEEKFKKSNKCPMIPLFKQGNIDHVIIIQTADIQ